MCALRRFAFLTEFLKNIVQSSGRDTFARILHPYNQVILPVEGQIHLPFIGKLKSI